MFSNIATRKDSCGSYGIRASALGSYGIKKQYLGSRMKVIYIIFFAILNLFIFSYLTKKIIFSSKVKVLFVSFIILFIISHFIGLLDSTISNEVFCILIFFSMSFFVFHYGRNIAIWFTIKINNNKRDELLFKWYNFWINYVMYVLIFVFQIATLIDLQNFQ